MRITQEDQIILLRKQGKTYNEIKKILFCSKATISYHCNKHGLGGNVLGIKVLNKEEILMLNEFYKTHTLKECAKEFNISRTTVINHVDNKQLKLTETEIRKNSYFRVKTARQNIKEKAVIYKGGKCSVCGYFKCSAALDFHHIDKRQKDFSISRYKVFSWDKIKSELDKCVLMCANCHREIHHCSK